MTITVPDNARGPILDLTLPASEPAIDIVLRNKTTGKQLTVNLPEGWEGTDLTLDFYRRTIQDVSGADRSALLDPEDNGLWTTGAFSAGTAEVEIEAWGPPLDHEATLETVEEEGAAGEAPWKNLTNTGAVDGSYATCAFSEGSPSSEVLWGVASTLPEDAVIVGVEARVWCKGSTTAKDALAQLVIGGEPTGDNKALPGYWQASSHQRVYGGPAELWGLPLTRSQLAEFGFRFQVEQTKGSEGAAEVDGLVITVYYQSVEGATPYVAKAKLRWEKGYF